MATTLGTVSFSWGSYSLAYDLLSQSVANNTSTVRLYGILNVTNNYVSWSRGSASVHTSGLQSIGTYYAKGSHTVITRDFTFSHDSSGKFSSYIGASLSTSYTSGDTGGTLTLPTIPRQATLKSAPNFNDEENPTITYSNPAGNNVSTLRACISLTGSTDDIPYRDISKTGSSYTFELTDEEREILRQATTTSNNRNVTFFIRTIIGGNTYHSTLIRTFTIVNGNPIFNNFEFEDISTETLALTGDSSVNVNGYSMIKVNIPVVNKAEAIKDATMSKYRFNIGESSLDINYSDENDVYGIIQNVTSGTYNVYAIDSRNNSTLVTKLASREINYETPYIDKQSTNIERNNNQVDGNVTLKLNGTFWNDNFGKKDNEIKISYQFKKTTSSNWINGVTTITPTIEDNKFSFSGEIASDNLDTTWDLDSSYNIRIIIEDELSIVMYDEMILNSAIPTMSVDKDGVGIKCAFDSSKGGILQIEGKTLEQYIKDVINSSS